MNIRRLAALAVLLVFGAAHAQEEQKQVEMKVIVAGDGGGDAKEFHWVGDPSDLHSLAIGESRTITAEDGSPVVVTHTGDGMQFDFGGETVVLPEPPPPPMGVHGGHGMHAIAVTDVNNEDVDVTVMGGGPHMIRARHPDGVTIISAGALDDSVRESIRSVLISAGVDDEVTFIDASEEPPMHVISKRIEISQPE